jgi:hypothetical protein
MRSAVRWLLVCLALAGCSRAVDIRPLVAKRLRAIQDLLSSTA